MHCLNISGSPVGQSPVWGTLGACIVFLFGVVGCAWSCHVVLLFCPQEGFSIHLALANRCHDQLECIYACAELGCQCKGGWLRPTYCITNADRRTFVCCSNEIVPPSYTHLEQYVFCMSSQWDGSIELYPFGTVLFCAACLSVCMLKQ